MVPAIFQTATEGSASQVSLAYSAGERDTRTSAEQGARLMGER